MTERTEWNDGAIEREVSQIWRAIDDLPGRMVLREADAVAASDWSRRIENEVRELRKEFSASRQGLSKPEKIALLGSTGGFIGALVAAIALFVGGGGAG